MGVFIHPCKIKERVCGLVSNEEFDALYEKYDVSWLLLPLRDASGIAIAYIDSRNLNHKGTPEKLKSLGSIINVGVRQ